MIHQMDVQHGIYVVYTSLAYLGYKASSLNPAHGVVLLLHVIFFL